MNAIYRTLVAMLAGIVLYAFLNDRPENLGQIPDPIDNPHGDSAAQPPGAPARRRARPPNEAAQHARHAKEDD
jgi:hypothetical protein